MTHQTGPEGQKVRRLLIEEGADIKKEYYVAVRHRPRHAEGRDDGQSSEGGMDIEEVAHDTPEKIHQGLHRPAGRPDRRAGATISPPASASRRPARRRRSTCCKSLYRCYMDTDASLAEINPLILEGNGSIKALDAKFNFDANALFRHPEIVAYRDLDEEDPAEIEASKFDLTYISWTATSAAWSTAPAWRWRRWTPSSCSAASRPTSSTSAAAPPPRR